MNEPMWLDEMVCIEEGCNKPALCQRFEDITSDGTPIVVLVCTDHGEVPI